MNSRKSLILLLAVILLAMSGEFALAASSPDNPETKDQRDARMAWWRDAKFGMFCHWGLYCVPGGTYDGKRISGIGEWIMHNAKIPVATYAQYVAQFNPTQFDADAWVKMAKDSGIKYIVITAKHHEGFAMFHTAVDNYNIFDGAPFHRDPLAELAAACKKYDMHLGFYYSQSQDWHHPGGGANGGHWDPAQNGSPDEYVDHVVIPQLTELLTHYGDYPDVLWFDTPGKDIMTRRNADKIYQLVKQLKPNIIINNRLGAGYHGDTETPEQYIPPTGYPGKDWEACMTLNDTWGYKTYDTNFKSTQTLLFNLIDIASKDGNFLLNVGPEPTGLIPQPEVDRLLAIGKWLKVNGDAVYGTKGSCFGVEYGKPVKEKDGYGHIREVSGAKDWRCTTKPGKIFIETFKWPGETFELPAVKGKVTAAHLLADPDHPLTVDQSENKVIITGLPPDAPDPIASVIALDVKE